MLGKHYAEAGMRSMAILPLVVSNEALGVLALYASEVEFFHSRRVEGIDANSPATSHSRSITSANRSDSITSPTTTSLTGLANRSLFLERVTQFMRSAVSSGHKLALYLIDLERFKNINDSLGRPAGDALLRQVAEWLTRNVGDANLLARVGSDHFAVVMPELQGG